MKPFLLVAAGGALGASLRWLAAGAVHRLTASAFPWGTFAVNVLGCLAFGACAALLRLESAPGSVPRVFLMVGVLGGFTTFSTFGWETFELLRDGQVGRAAGNAAGQVVLGILALWLGWIAVELWRQGG